MPKASAGLLLFRVRPAPAERGPGRLEVLLVHPGGPFWRGREAGAWTIPKGEFEPGEDPLEVAKREFEEETGIRPQGEFLPLRSVTQRGGKTVQVWAFRGDCDPTRIRSNTFSLEWPPGSGKTREFPEIDQARFFALAEAKKKINPAQVALLDELKQQLTGPTA